MTAIGPRSVVTDGGELRGDVILDASGRRSPVGKWLGAPEPLVEECGVIYYSRYFRLRAGAELPRGPWLWGPRAELPFAVAIVHLAERGVYSITFAVPTFDRELKALREPRAFAAVCELLPAFAPWADPERAEPISDVLAMGGLQNVLRDRPYVPGVLAIGDALCHTNAAYGWGMSLGMAHAAALADILGHTASIVDATEAYHAAVGPEARARWELSAQQDRARTRAWRGEPVADEDGRAAAQRTLAPAMALDATVFRAMMRCSLLLASADTLLAPDLLARARDVVATAPRAASAPPPTRDAALAAIRSALR